MQSITVDSKELNVLLTFAAPRTKARQLLYLKGHKSNTCLIWQPLTSQFKGPKTHLKLSHLDLWHKLKLMPLEL